MERKVYFTALGGAQEVGRSSFLLDAGEKIVLDRGVKLNPNNIEYPLPIKAYLDAVILSHAHLDHSGHLPALFLKGNVHTYLTPPTLELAKILWYDTLKIADQEGSMPHFTEEEIRKTEQYSFTYGYKRKISITKNMQLEFFDAGHIAGSALSKIILPEKEILYTGDYKVKETRLHEGADLKVGKVDTIILESTYGDREQPERKETEKEFIEKVNETIAEGGNCIIPAFAVGRAQEIIDALTEHKALAPIYLDGMGQKAAAVMLRYPKYLKNPKHLKKALDQTKWVRSNKKTRKAATSQPSIIVASAGMLQGGPVLNYIAKLYNDKKSALLFTGFQVEESPGRTLLDTGKITIDGKHLEVKMKIHKFDFSAHPSQSELIKSLHKWKPEKAVLVHGDKKTLPVFKELIEKELGIETIIPTTGKEIAI